MRLGCSHGATLATVGSQVASSGRSANCCQLAGILTTAVIVVVARLALFLRPLVFFEGKRCPEPISASWPLGVGRAFGPLPGRVVVLSAVAALRLGLVFSVWTLLGVVALGAEAAVLSGPACGLGVWPSGCSGNRAAAGGLGHISAL